MNNYSRIPAAQFKYEACPRFLNRLPAALLHSWASSFGRKPTGSSAGGYRNSDINPQPLKRQDDGVRRVGGCECACSGEADHVAARLPAGSREGRACSERHGGSSRRTRRRRFGGRAGAGGGLRELHLRDRKPLCLFSPRAALVGLLWAGRAASRVGDGQQPPPPRVRALCPPQRRLYLPGLGTAGGRRRPTASQQGIQRVGLPGGGGTTVAKNEHPGLRLLGLGLRSLAMWKRPSPAARRACH